MPMIWTEPEVVVEHKGVTVYHTYKDNGGGVSQFWYTLEQADDNWEGESAFDIRDLKVDQALDHPAILRAAIDAGLLKPVDDEGSTPMIEDTNPTANEVIVRAAGLAHSLDRLQGGTLIGNFPNSERGDIGDWARHPARFAHYAVSLDAWTNTGEYLPALFSLHVINEEPESLAFGKMLKEFWAWYETKDPKTADESRPSPSNAGIS